MNLVTRIINAIEDGDVQATDELLPLVYTELRQFGCPEAGQVDAGADPSGHCPDA